MNWDEYYINICHSIKLKSKDPKKKVGSCLVSNNNRILSTGYNGLKEGADDNIDWNNRKLVHSLIIHSEMNTILYSSSNYKDAVLYSTLSPCSECIKLIACSNIKKIIFDEKYKDYDNVKNICNFYNIELKQINYYSKLV